MSAATINTSALALNSLRAALIRKLEVADRAGIPVNMPLLVDREANDRGLRAVHLGEGHSGWSCVRAEGTDFFITISNNPWKHYDRLVSCVSDVRTE